MKYTFFTPGPSQLYPTVPAHIVEALNENIPSISHRSEKFQTIFYQTTDGVKQLLHIPKDYHIVFVASGTEAMERIIQNTVEQKSFHFVNGSFSARWYETALQLRIDAQKDEIAFGKGFQTVSVIQKDTELICFTHNETSSGVALHPEYIYNVAKENQQALIAVDIVSSAPFVDLDYTGLDCVFFSVQKLFGLPAGLGVLILSPRAVEKAVYLHKKGVGIGSYHNFLTSIEWAIKNQTIETPNVLGMYLFRQVVKDMLAVGIDHIRRDTEGKANQLYDFFDNHNTFKSFVAKEDRSSTVVVIDVGDSRIVLERLKQQGFVVGGGYGPFKSRQIRIANFPAVTREDIKKLLKALNSLSF